MDRRAAAILGIAGILLTSCEAAKPAAVASGTAAPAAASPAAWHTARDSCGTSGGPALAYETAGGSPVSGSFYVKVYCGSGVTRTVTTETGSVDGPLTWSGNGSQLDWWDGSEVTVVTFSGGAAMARRWACPTCSGVGFLGEQAVAVAMASVGFPPRAQLLKYPLSGSGPPVARMVTGLPPVSPYASAVAYGARMLGSLPSGGIVVDLVAANQLYTPAEQFYRIDSAGHATKLGTGAVASGTLRGIGNFAMNAAGTELAFTADAGCANHHHGDQGINIPSVLDPAAGTVTTPATPAGGGEFGYWVEGMWFDSSGTPHVSLVKNLSDCASSGPLWPPGATAIDCTLAGGRWAQTGSGILQEADGPGGWVAEATGAVPATSPAEVVPLAISDGSSVRAKVSNVSVFAWAP